jgi:hypothetical protein
VIAITYEGRTIAPSELLQAEAMASMPSRTLFCPCRR